MPNKDLLWAIAWAVVLVVSTFGMLGRLAPLPGRVQFIPLPLALILVLGSAGILISHLRAALTGVQPSWARMLPFFAPIVVWAFVGSIWAHWQAEANRSAIDSPVPVAPMAPDAGGGNVALPPLSPVQLPKPDENTDNVQPER